MAERLSNLGYLALGKQTNATTMVTPSIYVPLYDQTLNTNGNFIDLNPIVGQKFATYTTIKGQRSHKGDVTIMAEPNTTGIIADMLLNHTGVAGSGPYTHSYDYNGSGNYYTADISTGNVVHRYFGVQADSLQPNFNKNEIQWKVTLSALGSLQSRTLATVSTTTVTLDTTYDPAPNKGFVAGDLVRLYKASTGATLDTTIATVNTDGITLTLAVSAAAFAAGDMIYLRPATQALNVLNPFEFARTQFCFGATAAAALSNTHTPLDSGTTYTVTHSFNSADGEQRSGSYDPATLVRKTADASFSVKKFFDKPDDIQNFNQLNKTACVIRHFAGANNQYECRFTLNNLKTDGTVAPNMKNDEVLYSELKYHANYDPTDGTGYSFTVINNLATI